MARVILTWELGTGLSHIAALGTLGKALAERGHEVVAVLRDLTYVPQTISGPRITYLQAPIRPPYDRSASPPVISYAHILHHAGFGHPDTLSTLAGAWRNLFQMLAPDLIVFDHSPTALLAAQGISAKRVLFGTGFYHPPDTSPLPDLRPWMRTDPARLACDEAVLLGHANWVLRSWGQSPLDRLARVYHPVEASLVQSIPPLDPFADKRSAAYVGIWALDNGAPFRWPGESQPRIFGYLQPVPALPRLLELLGESGTAAVLYIPQLPVRLRRRFETATIQFLDRPADIRQACEECDCAMLSAGHALTTLMLLAGKPMLLAPPALEQRLNAMAARRIGAAVECPPDEPQTMETCFNQLMSEGSLGESARRFAREYEGQGRIRLDLVVQRFEELLRQ